MAKPLVSDELWEIVQPLLPALKPRRIPNPGRQRLDDRKALSGILFVLKSGIAPYQVRGRLWEMLPDASPGDGLRFRHDLLAPAAGLAAGWRVGKAS